MHRSRQKNSKSRDASFIGSQGKRVESFSPTRVQETTHLMEELTNHMASITENTKLLINGSEVLSKSGISGKINQVGVGFGTGRHTSSRKTTVPRENLIIKSQQKS